MNIGDSILTELDGHRRALRFMREDAANEFRFFDIHEYMDELEALDNFLRRFELMVIEKIEEEDVADVITVGEALTHLSEELHSSEDSVRVYGNVLLGNSNTIEELRASTAALGLDQMPASKLRLSYRAKYGWKVGTLLSMVRDREESVE